ncbi:UDP-glucose--hexose-1-phosphate uridylyltransferase [Lentibacillus sediminis]|uniref:UDP-glucose--hexose-1-phosphate uridylyltransferase n=1 Tax=Lentibacillus sediminis TaxID=1940529 RepID=UPI000C1BC43B|nr:UDP-glucose--hexose-1-phosphate uridylyltransferase [Lentibacillus sediminis]
MRIYPLLSGLVEKAIEAGLIEPRDRIYTRNQVMGFLRLEDFPDQMESPVDAPIPDLLEEIIDWAVKEHVIENVFDEKEILTASIMNCFVARPSAVNETFHLKYQESPEAATDFFYNLSKKSNYIQMKRISHNIHFPADTAYGQMDITINLSKPEKDPEQIKREREKKQQVDYPKCVLCVENEGYLGRTGYPARANHRVIQIPLLGENWYLQYSPYVYYQEHSIVLAEEHRDMKIDEQTFGRLLAFVEKFPHYFIGSNADLPIVGGSILSHDHYQAGRYEFAMNRAEEQFSFKLENFPEVRAAVLNWPLSVIRLRHSKKEKLHMGAADILQTWKQYSDEASEVVAFSGDTPHNTITPIARMKDGEYELDLVLRNNRTSGEHPMGVFHPHADVQHIKKENIGLIEVMGLAVLPARLKDELAEIRDFLVDETNKVADYHEEWAKQLHEEYGTVADLHTAEDILRKELGKKFARVLEDAGVFKEQAAFRRFIDAVNDEVIG